MVANVCLIHAKLNIMQHKYVNMQIFYVYMKHNNIDMQHIYVNMQVNYFNMRHSYVACKLKLCFILTY